jgi:hypothetical protein
MTCSESFAGGGTTSRDSAISCFGLGMFGLLEDLSGQTTE